ncbi:hypothetical protein JCM10295v2_000105 [Rhodotorula toruloides]
MSTAEAIIKIWLPVSRRRTVGSFLLFSPLTHFLASGLFDVFLAPLLEETFPSFPPLFIRFFSNLVLTQPYYRAVIRAYASQGVFFWGDPRLAPASSWRPRPPMRRRLLPPPTTVTATATTSPARATGRSRRLRFRERGDCSWWAEAERARAWWFDRWASVERRPGGSGGETGSSQQPPESAGEHPREEATTPDDRSEPRAPMKRKRRISPVFIRGLDVLLDLRSSSSLGRTWQGLQAKDTLVRLPPLLPFTINGFPTPAPSPGRPPAKRRYASTTDDGNDESSSTDDIVLEMEHVPVGVGSAGTLWRGKVGGASVNIKVSPTYDGLASEMESYQKLEAALAREGEKGLEPLTPIVGGRFRSVTDEEELMNMEDARTAMPKFSDWTYEQKSQGLRLLERLHKAGLQHGDVAERNFVLAADGTIRLIDLRHSTDHTCADGCAEIRKFRQFLGMT